MFTYTKTPEIVELQSRTINNQRWYTTPDGEKYPSVTTVLGNQKKEWLENWRAMLGEKKATKETKRCAERGTAVHELIELYLSNKEYQLRSFAQSNINLFNQTKLYLNRINNIRVLEATLYSDALRIAGRVDCVGEYDGVLSIIDFKTSSKNKYNEHVKDYKLQCCMYSLCWYEMFDELIDNFVILIAVEKGLVPLIFTGSIKNHIIESQKRIDDFYRAAA